MKMDILQLQMNESNNNHILNRLEYKACTNN